MNPSIPQKIAVVFCILVLVPVFFLGFFWGHFRNTHQESNTPKNTSTQGSEHSLGIGTYTVLADGEFAPITVKISGDPITQKITEILVDSGNSKKEFQLLYQSKSIFGVPSVTMLSGSPTFHQTSTDLGIKGEITIKGRSGERSRTLIQGEWVDFTFSNGGIEHDGRFYRYDEPSGVWIDASSIGIDPKSK